MEDIVTQLEKRISDIESRNRRVEIDKAWETSLIRRTMIAVFTYLPISLYMYYIGVSDPWLNAIVPTLGFLISTLTLPWIKTLYSKRFT